MLRDRRSCTRSDALRLRFSDGRIFTEFLTFVVRSAHDRALAKMDQQYLHDALAAAVPLGRRSIDLPAGKGRAARCATLEIRAMRVQLRAPRRPGTPLVDQEINVVEVREIEAPADADPVHWILLTDLPTDTLPELWKVVAIYRRRWLIEEFHKALKSGVGLEKSQLAEARKLMALAGILSIVACFLVGLKLHARSDGALPLDETQVDHATRVILEKKVGRPKEGWTYQAITFPDHLLLPCHGQAVYFEKASIS